MVLWSWYVTSEFVVSRRLFCYVCNTHFDWVFFWWCINNLESVVLYIRDCNALKDCMSLKGRPATKSNRKLMHFFLKNQWFQQIYSDRKRIHFAVNLALLHIHTAFSMILVWTFMLIKNHIETLVWKIFHCTICAMQTWFSYAKCQET